LDFDSYHNPGVQLATSLVNSVRRGGDDTLVDVRSLTAMLARLEVSAVGRLGQKDVDSVRRLRPALRAIFEAPNPDIASDRVNALLTESKAVPHLTRHDGEPWHLHYAPAERPVWARLAAEAAMGLAGVIKAGGFERMKVCAAEDCTDAFVDASKNQSRRFCNPETCGNRATTAAYRARRRQATPQLEAD
jgi:predicted RNA-binding Zn ribbon-like protein